VQDFAFIPDEMEIAYVLFTSVRTYQNLPARDPAQVLVFDARGIVYVEDYRDSSNHCRQHEIEVPWEFVDMNEVDIMPFQEGHLSDNVFQ
jgi:hypothetical protein